jgi:hypothetical protein
MRRSNLVLTPGCIEDMGVFVDFAKNFESLSTGYLLHKGENHLSDRDFPVD